MNTYTLRKEQVRNFILLKHGLIGDYKFQGKQGVCDFIKQAGCIQYDPIDICGRNAELVLQSRVKGFTKEILNELLYVDRKLVDYFDKNMSIFCIEDWKYFSRIRDNHRLYGRSCDKVDSIAGEIKRIIVETKSVCSKDLHLKEKVDWSWNPTTLSRAALETLYFCGDLVIHHKKGTMKYYALTEDHIASDVLNADNPNKTPDDFIKWQVLRRIGSIGLACKHCNNKCTTSKYRAVDFRYGKTIVKTDFYSTNSWRVAAVKGKEYKKPEPKNKNITSKSKVLLKFHPNEHKLKMRKCIVEHPFGTVKRWCDGSYLLVKGKVKVTADLAFSFLGYNMKRAINTVGVEGILAKI